MSRDETEDGPDLATAEYLPNSSCRPSVWSRNAATACRRFNASISSSCLRKPAASASFSRAHLASASAARAAAFACLSSASARAASSRFTASASRAFSSTARARSAARFSSASRSRLDRFSAASSSRSSRATSASRALSAAASRSASASRLLARSVSRRACPAHPSRSSVSLRLSARSRSHSSSARASSAFARSTSFCSTLFFTVTSLLVTVSKRSTVPPRSTILVNASNSADDPTGLGLGTRFARVGPRSPYSSILLFISSITSVNRLVIRSFSSYFVWRSTSSFLSTSSHRSGEPAMPSDRRCPNEPDCRYCRRVCDASKTVWNNAYMLELDNFKNFGDPGVEWFGHSIGQKMIKCVQSHCKCNQDDPILDVGCGNAMLLTQLAKLGFSNLYGIDYSALAVKLANSIVEKQKIQNITLKEFDFLTDNVKTLPTFALVLDKGTYDVIGMNDENKEKRNQYKENIVNLLRPNGMFLIVSCNWTQSELNEQFGNVFHLVHTIPTPSYQFGGAVGNTLSAILYKKM